VPRRLTAALALAAAVGAVAVIPASAAKPAPAGAPASPHLGIRHVFVIVLENESFDESYGPSSPAAYLSKTLPSQGTLLTQYFGTAHLSNPNYIAMVSGQAPNPANQSDCNDYVNFEPTPAVFDPRGNGQAVGQGCVYPSNVLTLADQLESAGLTWRGYMEDMGNDDNRESSQCGAPADSTLTGQHDGTQTAEAQDQYAARHNPFVYFHSLIDSGSCTRNVVSLKHLVGDLASSDTTPNFSFITPNLCHDGHDTGCADGEPGGLTSVDQFLSQWVPAIEASPAFQDDGLLVVTTDEAQFNQNGEDSTACCNEQPGPNSPLPGILGPGGGRIGSVVVGRCVGAGVQDSTPYNHYSLLRSLEDVFGITTGGADGKGHLGFAGASDLSAFGPDVFSTCSARPNGTVKG
jgi:phosphatidylinositol-3-phosphatase